MTSSQPVVTPNAINFTPDNKHAYAYSGNKAIINAEQTMIEGQTNSEYIRAKISISNFSGSGDDIRYYVYFNDVQVYGGYYNSTSNNNIVLHPLYITIPPFTKIKITAENLSGSGERSHTAVLVGEAVGMTEVGYQ
jgi:hypothetical protein